MTKPTDDDRLDDLIKDSLMFQAIRPNKPMIPGRKLTEALLSAGKQERSVEFWSGFDESPMIADRRLREAQRGMNQKFSDLADMAVSGQAPRRSFIRLIGSIAWRLLVVLVVVGVTVVVLAGGRT